MLFKAFHRFIFLFCIASCAYGAPNKLRKSDIRPTLEEMLSYHVEFKEISPLIVKRCFKLFIEQFDPEKIYLLRRETQPFLDLSEEATDAVIKRYYRDDFSDFEKLNQLFDAAIKRSRGWRNEMERALTIAVDDEKAPPGESYLHYAYSEEDLKQRIRYKVARFLLTEKKNGKAPWTPQRREKIFVFFERRVQRFESQYLYSGDQKEHYMAMHMLKAMARSLDAHTAYFSPDEALEMRTALEKEFEGIGVVLREGVDGIVITDLIVGGPAHKSGKIAPGDVLISVDGSSIKEDPYDVVLEKLHGNGKREVVLGLKRLTNDREDLWNVEIKREKIIIQDERLQVSYEPYADGIIGKLNLPSFYESSDESSCEKDMREAIRKLKKAGNIHGLVLDMRFNSGGFLNQAVKIAGLFITNGVIVISKYAQGEVQYLRDLDGRSYYTGPLVILTSKGSASAAEIVAAALQDYGIALIVGDERTYGKGTIQYQTVTDDDAKAYFKVTVGKYYTVSGKSTQIEGVKADIVVPTHFSPYEIGERYLEYPLKNDHIPSAYIDPLTDIDPLSRWWFQKNYLPNLQKRESVWIKMLPRLRDNSSYRLKNDPNFQTFLQNLEDEKDQRKPSKKLHWGKDDLQMGEAINIVKDMIIIQKSSIAAP